VANAASVNVAGMAGLRKYVDRMGKGGKKVLRAAMEAATEPAFKLTQERCPVKTGKLVRSGRISIRVGAKQITAKILYGGPDVPYAAWRHEQVGTPGAKWVEITVAGYPFVVHLAGLIDLEAMAAGA
jgi:hypothetical protein